jgi:hypothetical protein
MIDILKIQTFPISPSIEKLEMRNLDLALLNGKLQEEKQFYQTACVLMVISISVYLGYQLLFKTNEESK